MNFSGAPVSAVDISIKLVDIAMHAQTACALGSDGNVYTWGDHGASNEYRLGDGSQKDRFKPDLTAPLQFTP